MASREATLSFHVRRSRRIAVLCASLMGSLAIGCGEDDGAAEVSGTVMVDGVLAKSGAISFFPVDGAGSPVGRRRTNRHRLFCRVHVRPRVTRAVLVPPRKQHPNRADQLAHVQYVLSWQAVKVF